jgi:hypothetical protein
MNMKEYDETRNMKENSNFKIVKVVKSTCKAKLNHMLVSITWNNKH